MAKKPERTFRLGNISASVFTNSGSGENAREFRTVQVQRSYRDGDSTKYATNFTAGDLPAVVRVLQLAQGYVEEQDVTADAAA